MCCCRNAIPCIYKNSGSVLCETKIVVTAATVRSAQAHAAASFVGVIIAYHRRGYSSALAQSSCSDPAACPLPMTMLLLLTLPGPVLWQGLLVCSARWPHGRSSLLGRVLVCMYCLTPNHTSHDLTPVLLTDVSWLIDAIRRFQS